MGVWVAIETGQVEVDGGGGRDGGGKGERGPIGVLICVEEDVRAVVFVVTVASVNYRIEVCLGALAEGSARVTYSRAQRYGSNARMLGRAHVCKSKAVFFGAILNVNWLMFGRE